MIQLLALVNSAAADPACMPLSGGHAGQPTARLTSCSQNLCRFNCIPFNTYKKRWPQE